MSKATRDPSVIIRRWIMRTLLIALLPLALFTEPAWPQGSATYEIVTTLGVLMLFAGVMGRAWAIIYVGGRKAREVFQDGPYSICRHPLYFFSTVGATGVGLMLGSLLLAMLFGLITFSLLNITASKEERFLRQEFGPAYDDYAAHTPRILPRFSQFTTQPSGTWDLAQLRRNFWDALVFLSMLPIATFFAWLKFHELVPTLTIF